MRSRKTDLHAPHRGMTLIEVMIVLVILVILAGVSVGMYGSYIKSANKRQAEIYVKKFDTPLQNFRLHVGHFPATDEGLGALLECPPSVSDPTKWEGPYVVDGSITNDPWGNPYQYATPGTHSRSEYEIWSLGPDMVDGTEDDICSWSATP